MQINLSHAFGLVELKTENNSAIDLVEVEISVIAPTEQIKKYLKDEVKKELEEASDFSGHPFSLEAATNLDLEAAARSLPSFNFLGAEPPKLKYQNPPNVQT